MFQQLLLTLEPVGVTDGMERVVSVALMWPSGQMWFRTQSGGPVSLPPLKAEHGNVGPALFSLS